MNECYTWPMSPETLTPVTVEAFWHIAHDLPRSELVAGQVIELVPPGIRHGRMVVTLGRRLEEHVADLQLGIVVTDAGFILSRDPATVRGPDLAVILAPRVPSPLPVKFFPGPPDLAVEILSPDDRPGEVAAKVADYLRAGTQSIWVIDPEAQTITVHTRAGATRYGGHESLDGAPVLPVFHVPVATLFAEAS